MDKISKYFIGIPSRGRFFMLEKRMGIWRYIDPSHPDHLVNVFVREEEVSFYQKNYLSFYTNIVSCPNNITIAEKRKAMLTMAQDMELEFLFIIDDDVRFFYRDENITCKYGSQLEETIKRDTFRNLLMDCMKICSPEYPVVGVPLKQGSQSRRYYIEKNVQLIRFVCYHVPTFTKENIDICGLGTTFMSDRHAQLEMLSRGYRSLALCMYAVDDMGTGYKGGCSNTRSVDLQSEAAHRLCEKFPGYVELKTKSNSLHWTEERVDCKIYWKNFLRKGELPYLTSEEASRYGFNI